MIVDMFMDAGGLQVHYEVCGAGENVLMLHGWGGRIGSFAPVIAGLSQYRRVIALDFPGFGETPPPPEPWSVTEYTGLVIEFIRRLGIEGCDIVAHSFGGRVAIMLASEHPELVSKLVLVDAAGIRPRRTLKYHFKVRMFKLGKRVTRSRACMRLLGPIGRALEKKQKSAGSEDYRALSEDMRRTFVRVVNQDLRPLLPKIKAPTLLVWGDQDADAPLYMGRIMEKEIPGAGLVVFEGAGHFSYLDRFDQFMRVLRSFLGGGK
jgi:pimeloyl-ACP methyl ester carboxylesterase